MLFLTYPWWCCGKDLLIKGYFHRKCFHCRLIVRTYIVTATLVTQYPRARGYPICRLSNWLLKLACPLGCDVIISTYLWFVCKPQRKTSQFLIDENYKSPYITEWFNFLVNEKKLTYKWITYKLTDWNTIAITPVINTNKLMIHAPGSSLKLSLSDSRNTQPVIPNNVYKQQMIKMYIVMCKYGF